jgi:hypothetical protein
LSVLRGGAIEFAVRKFRTKAPSEMITLHG